ncbi:serine/threonine-protein kinase, partial [uncultured Amphritea sp.]|uniref:serine/threonine protein kinase n=1 Tax=uncultured Amphritea sp. TaxID=981605 RepID=UPI00262B2E60
IIYRGKELNKGIPVTLKVLKGEYPSTESLIKFKREYEITRDIRLDGVIRVYDLKKYQNTLVMIMEDFRGKSLAGQFSENTFNLMDFLQLSIQITDILGEIHRCSIIHKDINPSNILWNPDTGQAKLISFGISTKLTRENPEACNPNVLEGTLAYMSPEQTGRMNRTMDYRTDFYSLGATFFWLLTKQRPFETGDVVELIHCHIAKTPVSPSVLNGQIPDALSQIILKLMAKNAEDRYQNIFGLKQDLQCCLDQLNSSGKIDPFEIGQKDISNRFQIPQKLYGREKEIEVLKNSKTIPCIYTRCLICIYMV